MITIMAKNWYTTDFLCKRTVSILLQLIMLSTSICCEELAGLSVDVKLSKCCL